MITLKAEAEMSRREQFNGKEHLVIPIIALVEGVLTSANSSRPELALSEEFGKAPAGWDGRPVVVNHPEMHGHHVSANSPKVLESEQIGHLFNTVLVDKKLKTEAWIDLDKVKTLNGEISATVDRLLAGEKVEISTGLFTDTENHEGVHEGDKFEGIWRNVVPDHLAILTEGTIGACSVADGCGANRINAAGKSQDKNNVASTNQTLDDEMHEKKSLFDKIKSFVGIKTNEELSHNTVLNAIEAALSQEEGFSFVVDVFKAHFIEQSDGGLFKRNFKITKGNKVQLGEERVSVRPEIGFVELKTNEEELMDKKDIVAELIANEATRFEESDTEFLTDLDEDQLEKFQPITVKPVEKPLEISSNAVPVVVPLVVTNVEKPETTPQTTEEYISAAPPAVQAVLRASMATQEAQKVEMITAIKTNSRNKFSDENLEAMPLSTLENLAALAVTEDYSTRGGPRLTNLEDPNAIPAPVQVFDLSRAS